MSILKRGRIYWVSFRWNGRRIQRSTKQTNANVARQIEAALRTSLAKGDVGITEHRKRQLFSEFISRFLDHMAVHCVSQPRTLRFWKDCAKRLLSFAPLANAAIEQIDEALIARFVHSAVQQKVPGADGVNG
jgi:hypothetical protein